MTWNLIIPVKGLHLAKSRLRRQLDGVADLALAFALDTLAAAQESRAVQRIILVSNDARMRAAAPRGVLIVDDPGTGLNPAVAAGLRRAGPGPAAVVTADLPGVRAADLDRVLAAAGPLGRAMVTDHSGRGTTLLAGRAPDLDPKFGPGSRQRHEGSGHTVLDVPPSSPLRWDVDELTDLTFLLRRGVGAHTARAVAARGVPAA
ncbi:2-phospho-L-lactate guanylyltransferase [Arthrobacter crusticola]|uniref:2-phospho-L-lactate guanylyltransferase n=1 Tax=Arthrobacter crusticola TaxID=2547960 RepID=A0A4R5TU05_9MICC|nr:2-phospho-L-lactate guanylyltransferase [Arthrobacter crusticola]TDK24499.1 2-phospho-L-lactate guanylyltransferase [Arthrobacter crusticola]